LQDDEQEYPVSMREPASYKDSGRFDRLSDRRALVHRVNHQVKRLKGQCVERDVVRVRHQQCLLSRAAVFLLNFYCFDLVVRRPSCLPTLTRPEKSPPLPEGFFQ
jgi:hypothetical protein